jgi:hypothetical protein
VIVKLPQDDPRTEEPIVYGFAKLQSSNKTKVKSASAIHLSELADQLYQGIYDEMCFMGLLIITGLR